MSVGLRVYDNTGTLEVDFDETLNRLVHVESFAYNWSGTFSVPAFDDTKGTFAIITKASKYDKDYAYPSVTDSHPDTDAFMNVIAFAMPSFYWDNTAKTMTVTAAPTPPTSFLNHPGDISVAFIHFK